MTSFRQVARAVIASWMMLHACQVPAQGRGPTASQLRDSQPVRQTVPRDEKLKALDAWLQRLEGDFSFKGTAATGDWQDTPCRAARRSNPQVVCTDVASATGGQVIQGFYRCHGIGAKSGLQCRIEITGQHFPGVWDPQLAMLGLDPDAAGIRYLHIDHAGTTDTGLGTLARDTVNFKLQCPKAEGGMPVVRCDRILTIFAPANRKYVRLTMSVDVRHRPRSGVLLVEAPATVEVRLERSVEKTTNQK